MPLVSPAGRPKACIFNNTGVACNVSLSYLLFSFKHKTSPLQHPHTERDETFLYIHPAVDGVSSFCAAHVYTELVLSLWQQDISHNFTEQLGPNNNLGIILSLKHPLHSHSRHFTAASQVSEQAGGSTAPSQSLTLSSSGFLFGSPSTSEVNIWIAGKLHILLFSLRIHLAPLPFGKRKVAFGVAFPPE